MRKTTHCVIMEMRGKQKQRTLEMKKYLLFDKHQNCFVESYPAPIDAINTTLEIEKGEGRDSDEFILFEAVEVEIK